MSTLEIERTFAVDPDKVFKFVTNTEYLLDWWGPEGVHISLHALDLSKIGDWYSVMENKEGQQYKVSGQVLSIDPPNSVEFTWAWHDDKDNRGNESTVRFEVRAGANGGSIFKLIHSGLADPEAAINHEQGWSSSLRKLDKLAA